MRLLFFVCIFGIAGGCVSPLDVGPVEFTPKLVVNGLLTNDSDSHFVELYLTAPTHDPKGRKKVPGALIKLFDDLGEHWDYIEVERGRYEVANVGAQVGRSYFIEIVLESGVTYRSNLQLMRPAGEIKNVFSQIQNIAAEPLIDDPIYAFNIFADAETNPGAGKFFRWRLKGTYEIYTRPELATAPNFYDPNIETPKPYKCSGYIFDFLQGVLFKREDCTCCQCWVTEYIESTVISDNALSSDGKLGGIQVGQIPVDRFRFFRKYNAEVEQLSISEEVYRFWKQVNVQAESGSIFQSNISKVTGNVYNVENPDDKAMGIFSVSAVTRKSLSLLRGDVPQLIPPMDDVTLPCNVFIEGAVTTKPDFW